MRTEFGFTLFGGVGLGFYDSAGNPAFEAWGGEIQFSRNFEAALALGNELL